MTVWCDAWVHLQSVAVGDRTMRCLREGTSAWFGWVQLSDVKPNNLQKQNREDIHTKRRHTNRTEKTFLPSDVTQTEQRRHSYQATSHKQNREDIHTKRRHTNRTEKTFIPSDVTQTEQSRFSNQTIHKPCECRESSDSLRETTQQVCP
jgi:hypothetical protein